MKLSIVLPAFNEEENIQYIYNEIDREIKKNHDDLELIFIDDGSTDKTFEEIKKLSQKDPRVKGYSFSRNFGQQSALLAGLSEASGELIVTMDCDGQHPVSVVKELITESEKGFDVVNTRRLSTADSGWFKRKSSAWYYRLLNMLSNVDIEPNSSDFRLMTKKARDAFLQIEEQSRFTRGLVSWIGFRQGIVSFHAPERFAGQTKYTLKKMIRFSIDGITSFSSKPLRISLVIGFFVLSFGIIYSIYAVVMFFSGKTNPGWTSLLLSVLLIGGIQLLTLGILGEYLGRIFDETKKRPHYFIQDKC